jgi:hypothetical protein
MVKGRRIESSTDIGEFHPARATPCAKPRVVESICSRIVRLGCPRLVCIANRKGRQAGSEPLDADKTKFKRSPSFLTRRAHDDSALYITCTLHPTNDLSSVILWKLSKKYHNSGDAVSRFAEPRPGSNGHQLAFEHVQKKLLPFKVNHDGSV